jgi:FkbM family methyltransferase
MSQINDISFTLNGVTYKFKMTYHPDNPCDIGMMTEFNKWGACEPELLHVMQRVIKPGMFVIDGGANVGFFTVLMSQMVGPKGKVLAIEPGENNLWKLEQNLKVNKIKNVEIVRRPLWNRHERVKLYLSPDPGTNSLAPQATGFKEMEAMTLADCPGSDFIKLDIEGSEGYALEGDEGASIPPYIVVELNELAMARLKSTQGDLRDMMLSKGYETFLIHRNGSLPSLVPEDTIIVPQVLNTNIMFSTLEWVSKAWPEARL